MPSPRGKCQVNHEPFGVFRVGFLDEYVGAAGRKREKEAYRIIVRMRAAVIVKKDIYQPYFRRFWCLKTHASHAVSEVQLHCQTQYFKNRIHLQSG